MDKPLILTLSLNREAQFYFDTLRRQYFPKERNFLDAHLTLFHQLPPNIDAIISDMRIAVKQHSQMRLHAEGVVSIGNGVAVKVNSEPLLALYSQLQLHWQQYLIKQDKQKLWPHITVQNKVSPDIAKTLLKKLTAEFKPFHFTGTGLSVWEYQGGPWRFIENFEFYT